ncbi:MAG: recombinase family protein [Candidatus Sungbacteria bacterium]|nr:recombinase family protein [Candidatus Sungbacteria bacterium]
MEAVLAAVAEFDNNVRAERTAAGMKTRMQNGYWCWGAPLGYVNTKDAAGIKIIAPHQEKAPLIKMLFEEYAKGTYTMRQLAEKANKLSLRTKYRKKVIPQRIAAVLKNPIYYGMVVVPKWNISVQGIHEPLVSKETFSRVQSVMHGKNTRPMPRNRDNPDFKVRGVKCLCGKSITGGWVKGRNRRYPYYGCFNSDCPYRKAISKDAFERSFTEFLEKLTPNPQFFEALEEGIRYAYKDETAGVEKTNSTLEKKITSMKEQREKYIELRANSEISAEDLKESLVKFDKTITELEMSKETISHTEIDVDHVLKASFSFLESLSHFWHCMTSGELRVLRSILFPKNLVYAYPGFQTEELVCFYTLNQAYTEKKDDWAAPPGVEPGFPH